MDINSIKQAFAATPAETAIAAQYSTNCSEIDVDSVGDVWIANPGTGHWMTDQELTDLADWIESETGQNLLTWAGIDED